MRMTRRILDALVVEAQAAGLDVKGKCDGRKGILTFITNERSFMVLRKFARKYGAPTPDRDGLTITIDARDVAMPKEIANFHNALIALAKAEHELNNFIQPKVTELDEKGSSMDVMEFIQGLPVDYPGMRRLYEMVYHKQDEERSK